MPPAHLRAYERYGRVKGFPQQRLELLLAQVSLVLARVNGNKDATLDDFMLHRAAAAEGLPPAGTDTDFDAYFAE